MPVRIMAALAVVALIIATAVPTKAGASPSSSATPTVPSSAPASQPALGGAPWVGLAWEPVDSFKLPERRWLTNVLSSDVGTLVRMIERADSPTVSILATTDGRSWTSSTVPIDDAPMGWSIDGAPEWLQVMVPLEDGAPLELLASSDGRAWELRGRLPRELDTVHRSAIRDRAIVACGTAADPSISLETCAASTDMGAT